MNSVQKRLCLSAAILAGIPVHGVMAATQTTTFQVTATVQKACLINSAADLAFGSYFRRSASTATSDISVTCTNSTPFDVGLNAGTFPAATVTTRQMTGPSGASLAYNLYSDAGRTINWGNTIGVDAVHGTGNGAAQTMTVYGTVPVGQHPTPGGYVDTITVTLTF
ncbi:MAG TPA: spore coat U domain-containing protein [Rhizomicrobium sp.]|jgi:spore coat protein U-like protein